MNKLTILLTALTPIAHGDTVTGMDNATNKKIFMRQQQMVDGFPMPVPHLTENAIRGGVFRQTLANHLVQSLEIQAGELNQATMNLLFSGGSKKKGSHEEKNSIELEHKIKRIYPFLDFFGGATDALLMRGKLRFAGWLVAKENKQALKAVQPDLLETRVLNSAFDMISEEVRTRGTNEESEGNQMPYGYEVLAAGSEVLLEITFNPRTSLETQGLIALALEYWDGFFGGQARQGRGRMTYTALTSLPSSDAYLDHLEKNKAAMRAGLIDGTFGSGIKLCD